MDYKLVGIAHCEFKFIHSPSKGFVLFKDPYQSLVTLELRTEQFGAPVLIRFFEKAPDNVIAEESGSKVLIGMPISHFAGFYALLQEAFNTNKYTVKLKTIGQGTLTLAKFDFLPIYS